jgi:hypothetical protein
MQALILQLRIWHIVDGYIFDSFIAF